MSNCSGCGRLGRKSLIAVFAGAILVTQGYFIVDRPVAFFVYQQGLSHYALFELLTDPPPLVQAWAPVFITILMVRWAWGPLRRWQIALLAAAVGMIVADQFRETLSYAFGRYWPETWTHNNPSLIQNNAYGFHPFHSGSAYGSFPSGHMARTLAIAAVVWISYPAWRWATILAPSAIGLGLVMMNYHFVSDVIAGSFVGALVGTHTAHYLGLAECTSSGEKLGVTQRPS